MSTTLHLAAELRLRADAPAGTLSHGMLTGFNKTVLDSLPRSVNLIMVESVLMAAAFLAMLMVSTKL